MRETRCRHLRCEIIRKKKKEKDRSSKSIKCWNERAVYEDKYKDPRSKIGAPPRPANTGLGPLELSFLDRFDRRDNLI